MERPWNGMERRKCLCEWWPLKVCPRIPKISHPGLGEHRSIQYLLMTAHRSFRIVWGGVEKKRNSQNRIVAVTGPIEFTAVTTLNFVRSKEVSGCETGTEPRWKNEKLLESHRKNVMSTERLPRNGKWTLSPELLLINSVAFCDPIYEARIRHRRKEHKSGSCLWSSHPHLTKEHSIVG